MFATCTLINIFKYFESFSISIYSVTSIWEVHLLNENKSQQ